MMQASSMANNVIDIRGRRPISERRPLAPNGVIGTLLFVGTELMLFAAFISAHAIARTTALTGWPPPNQPRLPAEETAINTAALLVSGVALILAQVTFEKKPAWSRRWFLVSLLLGAFFVAFQGMEWLALIREGLTLTSSTHGGFFYIIIGTHALHAVAALIFMVLQYWQHLRGKLERNAFAAMQVFWYFVVGMWPILYWKVYF